MGDLGVMCGRQPVRDARQQLDNLPDGAFLRLDPVLERPPVDELGDKVLPPLIFAGVVKNVSRY